MLSQFALSRFRSQFAIGALGLFMGIGIFSLAARAQESRTIIFQAPGADTTPGDFNGTYPTAINAFGAITGAYQDAGLVFHGFVRSLGGKFTTFDCPGADTTPGDSNGTIPNSINDLGVITGQYSDANFFLHGFVRSPQGKFTRFDVPGVGGFGTNPIAINLEGAIVGWYTDANYAFRAFLRTPDGRFKTWIGPGECTGNGSDGCFGTGASNINAFGIVVGGFPDDSGNFVHHNFLRTPDGKLKTFDVPSAGTGSYQGTGCSGCYLGLNQFGAIAGIYSDSNSVNHGYLRTPDGKFTTFDAPGAGTDIYQGTGCFADCQVAINNLGAITGTYIDSDYNYHGYLRDPKGRIVTVDPAGSIFTSPAGINDAGAVTGTYYDANLVWHGFVRIPDR